MSEPELLLRVFPRRTRATPIDTHARFGPPDLFDEADRVEVSVSFSWDLPRAEQLAEAWRRLAPVKIGGPAIAGTDGDGEFHPGHYLRPGYTITSRGCPGQCRWCSVWRRFGPVRELTIRDGWIVQDDNLLACSDEHIWRVFQMLSRQPYRASFAGGLDASLLTDWHVGLLADLTPRPEVFFSYDEPGDWEPLVVAAGKLWGAGFTEASHRVRCYVLIGFPGDTHNGALLRLAGVKRLGVTPAAMLYRAPNALAPPDAEWRKLQREWMRPAIIHTTCRSRYRRREFCP